MNHATHTFGDSSSVAARFGTESGIVRPEKLLDVLCYNNTAGVLYMLIFGIQNSLIPFGTVYAGGGGLHYTLAGLTVGHLYSYSLGANETSLTNGAQVFNSPNAGTFVATANTAAFLTANAASLVTATVIDLTAPQATPAPVAGSTPKFNFPVQSGLGGTLGRSVDMQGIYCVWSTTPLTLTAAGASGPIEIVVKG